MKVYYFHLFEKMLSDFVALDKVCSDIHGIWKCHFHDSVHRNFFLLSLYRTLSVLLTKEPGMSLVYPVVRNLQCKRRLQLSHYQHEYNE